MVDLHLTAPSRQKLFTTQAELAIRGGLKEEDKGEIEAFQEMWGLNNNEAINSFTNMGEVLSRNAVLDAVKVSAALRFLGAGGGDFAGCFFFVLLLLGHGN